jgi:hypothetical protein
MPHKYNADRHHRIPKTRYKVTNWKAYEAGLRQRGSLTIWFTDEAIAAWRAAPRTTPGGQARYSALVHGGRRARISPWFVDHQAALTDSGRPRSNIRLRTVTAIRVSTSWAGRVCERKVSPMMRLYRLIVPSAPALAL